MFLFFTYLAWKCRPRARGIWLKLLFPAINRNTYK